MNRQLRAVVADSGNWPLTPGVDPLSAEDIYIGDTAYVDINDIRAIEKWGTLTELHYPVAGSAIFWHRKTYYIGEFNSIDIAVGGLKFPDTLVSGMVYGAGVFTHPKGRIHKVSSIKSRRDYHPTAKHELELYHVLHDAPRDPSDSTPRLGIEVHETLLGWNRHYLKRALISDSWIVNTSDKPIVDGCFGVVYTADVYNKYLALAGGARGGTICGLIPFSPGIIENTTDTLNLVWSADNDGDASHTNWRFEPQNPTAVMGVRILRAPKGGKVSFNWADFYADWGPKLQLSIPGDPLPQWPTRQEAFYQRMSNGELDYDMVMSAIDMTPHGWFPPMPQGQWYSSHNIADGMFPLIMLSVGPFDEPIMPGDSVPFTYAIVMGDDFHTDPQHFARTFDYDNPATYLNGLNFTDLISAAQWAGWFFDNPGVDTDGDGFAGNYHLIDCDFDGCDTVYYSGDGVPDFKGPEPPPPPPFEVTTFPQKIRIRWTGAMTEYARDKHLRVPDWEGYKVWIAEDDTLNGYTCLGGWDREDYVRYSYRPYKNDWKQSSHPLTRDEWQEVLGDPAFDPNDYTMPSLSTCYKDIAIDTVRTPDGTIIDIVEKERFSYFGPGAENHANSYRAGGRQETNLIQQVGTQDTVIDGITHQFGIYEFELDWLSQSRSYWIAVTASDYGDYRNHIDPEESTPGAKCRYFRALYSADVVVDSGLKVNVHPNPYKIRFTDWQGNVTNYQTQGYEIPLWADKFDERDRRVWFTNLPEKAVIEIYSLDGDLIRRIRHPDTYLTKYSSCVGWDLISRNQQAVTSGIYIWRVTSELGSQVGKLVIIK